MRIDKKYILLALLFIGLILFEYFAPKEPDWSYSFSKDSKIPFGDYVLYDLLPDIFPGKEISVNQKSLYNFIEPDLPSNYSYIINTDNFSIDEINRNSLLNMVDNGANVFISAMGFDKTLSDTLKFATEMLLSNSFEADSMHVKFKNPTLQSENDYFIQKAAVNYHFSEFDSTITQILGTMDKERPNFIKITFGEGRFYLHSQPIAFTNYNMLIKNNTEYVFKALSYINNNYIVWDEKYKPGTSNKNMLAYVLKNKSLRFSYYLLLSLIILFFIFNGKRKQKPIPVIKPHENSSLEFVGTLSNLYLNNKNHKDILLKRYLYWSDFLREKYYLAIEKTEGKTAESIAEKTGVNIDCINNIIKHHQLAKDKKNVSPQELLIFNKLIEKFYKERN